MGFRTFAAFAIVALGSPCVAQTAAPPSLSSREAPTVSWGKPDVSFEQYRAEALTCSERGYYADVSRTEAAKTFVEASGKIDNLQGSGDYLAIARVVQGARPEKRFREVADFMRSTVDLCLTELGYERFALTQDQRKHAAKLRIGTPERHAYLHSLASNPQVLEVQALREQSARNGR